MAKGDVLNKRVEMVVTKTYRPTDDADLERFINDEIMKIKDKYENCPGVKKLKIRGVSVSLDENKSYRNICILYSYKLVEV